MADVHIHQFAPLAIGIAWRVVAYLAYPQVGESATVKGILHTKWI